MAELDRRTVLRGMGGVAAVGMGSLVLGGCGTSGGKQDADECKSTDVSSTEKTLVISNWP